MKKPDGKVVLLGDMNVGKTSLLHRYMERRFQETVSTVGGAFYLKQWGPYNISIWDTAGERLPALPEPGVRCPPAPLLRLPGGGCPRHLRLLRCLGLFFPYLWLDPTVRAAGGKDCGGWPPSGQPRFPRGGGREAQPGPRGARAAGALPAAVALSRHGPADSPLRHRGWP